MKKFIYLIMTAMIVFSSFYTNTIEVNAKEIETWEELREWARQNGGIKVTQGGTYDEYSTCPGEVTPNNNTVSSSNTTSTETKVEVEKKPAHEHSYIETITTEPTCIEEGVKTFTCSCGEKYTEPIDVVAHDYSKEIVSQEATCTVNGKKLISCSVCNDTYEEDIKSLGHEKGEWIISKRATCTENGEEVVNCKRCGEMLETKEVVALGHTDGEWYTTKKATLFDEGLNELRCATCEEVLETEVIPINMNTWYIIIGVVGGIIFGSIVLFRKVR